MKLRNVVVVLVLVVASFFAGLGIAGAFEEPPDSAAATPEKPDVCANLETLRNRIIFGKASPDHDEMNRLHRQRAREGPFTHREHELIYAAHAEVCLGLVDEFFWKRGPSGAVDY